METKILQMLLEQSPIVVILLLLKWHDMRQMDKLWAVCVKHLMEKRDDEQA